MWMWRFLERRQKIALLGMVLVAVLAFYVRIVNPPQIIDDAYITFRYAQHIAEGEGFVYNPGERVLGTSTPLYTLILALGAYLLDPDPESLPQLAVVLNSLFGACSAVALFLLAGRLIRNLPAAFAVSLLFAFNNMSVTYALGGMETSLYVALLLSSLLFVLYRRPSLGLLLAALAILCRPDGILFSVPLVVSWFVAHRKFDKKLFAALGAFAIPLIAWSLFSYFYFGELIPNTIHAKRLAYSSDVHWFALTGEFYRHATNVFAGGFPFQPSVRVWVDHFLLALFCLGTVQIVRRQPLGWIVPGFPLIHAVAFSVASPFLFQWYAIPPLPFWTLAVVAGIDLAAELIARAVDASRNRRLWMREGFAGALGIAAIVSSLLLFETESYGLRPKMIDVHREDIYREVAGELRKVIPEESLVALAEIGAFGYYHPARVLDAVGLVSPEALRYYPLDRKYYKWNSAIPPRLIQDEHPDFVVAFEDFMRLSLLESRSFKQSYRLVKEFPYQLWQSPGPFVYRLLDRNTTENHLVESRKRIEKTEFDKAIQNLTLPLYYSLESRERALEILDEDFCKEISRLSPWEKKLDSDLFVDLEKKGMERDWHLLDRWGRVFRLEGETIEIHGQIQFQNLDIQAVDLEYSPWGWLVLDSAGSIYQLGKGEQPLPGWANRNGGGEIDSAIDFELTPDAEGMYILNSKGAIERRGETAEEVETKEGALWDFDIARDMELSPDGRHLYIIDGFGGVQHFGPREGIVESRETLYWGWDIVRDIEFIDGYQSLLVATGFGSLHRYGMVEEEMPSNLPYPEWDYLVDVQVDPSDGTIWGMDSNGRLYPNRQSQETE